MGKEQNIEINYPVNRAMIESMLRKFSPSEIAFRLGVRIFWKAETRGVGLSDVADRSGKMSFGAKRFPAQKRNTVRNRARDEVNHHDSYHRV